MDDSDTKAFGTSVNATLNVLELFSGIGGFHCALQSLKEDIPNFDFNVKAAADINTVANQVYKNNFKSTPIISKSIQNIPDSVLSKFKVDLLVMSPPCQPFTRVGLKLDLKDSRSEGLSHVINCLQKLVLEPTWILLENVKGFEDSEACRTFLKCVEDLGYSYNIQFLHPFNFGIPNARLRCYILASKRSKRIPNLNETLQLKNAEDCCLAPYLSNDVNEQYYIDRSLLDKYLPVMDIVHKGSTHCMCFTKSYSRYYEGTGSIVCEKTSDTDSLSVNSLSSSQLKSNLDDSADESRLRLFTEFEVAALLSFPTWFTFPDDVTRSQRYKLLGNSLNVHVVKELLKHLLKF